MNKTKFSLDPGAITSSLIKVALFLACCSIIGQCVKFFLGHGSVYGLVQLVYFDEEKNLPTAFSIFLLLFSSVLLAVIYIIEKRRAKPNNIYWMVLSIGFFYLAIDEAWSIHESWANLPIHNLVDTNGTGMFHFIWVIPGIVVALAAFLFFLKFLIILPVKVMLSFIYAGALYVGGAIGFELIGGYYAGIYGNNTTFSYTLIATFEESLEMAGVILFIRSLLTHIAVNYTEVNLDFNKTIEEGTQMHSYT